MNSILQGVFRNKGELSAADLQNILTSAINGNGKICFRIESYAMYQLKFRF